MKSFPKQWDAASVLVRLGGILQLCCDVPVEPANLNPRDFGGPRIENIRPYPINYGSDTYIHAPGPHGSGWIHMDNVAREINSQQLQNREALISEGNPVRRNFPGFKYERIHRPQSEYKNVHPIETKRDKKEMYEPRPVWYLQPSISVTPSIELSSSQNPWIITDVPSSTWDQNHWVPGERFTILPTISVVPAWEHNHRGRKIIDHKLIRSENHRYPTYLNPTPVFWSKTESPEVSTYPLKALELPKNLTGRFFDMLRTVIKSAEIEKKNLTFAAEDYLRETEQNNEYSPVLYEDEPGDGSLWNLFRRNEGSKIDATDKDPTLSSTKGNNEKGVAFTPVLQICAVMAVLVLLLILFYHHQHIRRECTAESNYMQTLKRKIRNGSIYSARSVTSSVSVDCSASESGHSVIDIETKSDKINDVTL